ncbi:MULTISPECIES: hypothetical protein [Candidatus Nitrosocaldus]|jgi:hypothetical protein|uniref:DUF5655 domain-containing protein n=1 Tax=Candidatus Nitrosocaldus cavascurensis TaxID=2058097 RepID=A0A2K5ATA8_9ARCH|nr:MULTISPECIES: hypothetical protein [Candidatus Nitrosocaldus]SPC34873.1 conserved protein of unknown function [Candidatus Nitrosocaldus cavascurensis]
MSIDEKSEKLSLSDHLARLSEPARNMLMDIRDYVLSLPSVIEEIRPHRIVYSKGFNMRIFMDIEPAMNMLAVNIKTESRAPPSRILLRSINQLQDLYGMIRKAYEHA